MDNSNRWAGAVRLLAVHNRALSEEQIRQNFDAGVGEKFFLLFNVSDHVNIADAYIVFEVSQFDSYSYLFNTPFFTILGSELPGDIPVQGMRIGINGREAVVGQAYKNLDTNITDANYQTEGSQQISTLGTVIALEKGPTADEFFLSFERLADETNVVVEADPSPPATPTDVPREPAIGLRTFDEINASMAAMTTVPATNPDVVTTFDLVKQQLPTLENINGFLSSHQMGVTQLAIEYCNALVEDPAQRSSYFPGFDFTAPANSAFDTTGRDQVIIPLLDRMIGNGLDTQPDRGAVRTEIESLIDRLTACGGSCASDHTRTVVKASCAAVLGSAPMLLQ